MQQTQGRETRMGATSNCWLKIHGGAYKFVPADAQWTEHLPACHENHKLLKEIHLSVKQNDTHVTQEIAAFSFDATGFHQTSGLFVFVDSPNITVFPKALIVIAAATMRWQNVPHPSPPVQAPRRGSRFAPR